MSGERGHSARCRRHVAVGSREHDLDDVANLSLRVGLLSAEAVRQNAGQSGQHARAPLKHPCQPRPCR